MPFIRDLDRKAENIRAGLARVKPDQLWWLALLSLYALFKLWLVSGVELGKDEAAYWYWGQHLDASYALLPFGVLKLAHALLPGHEWSLRLGSILCGTFSIVLLYRLCRLHGLEPSLCRWAAASFACSHWIWHTTSYLHPDGFLVTCWLLALLWARQSAESESPAAHVKIGLAAGLAVLSKYSGAFLALGLFTWILATRDRAVRSKMLLWTLVPFLLLTAPLIHAQLSTLFYLPTTLGTLSQIAAVHHVLARLFLFLLNPLFFVSPLLLYLLYKSLFRQRPREHLLALLPALFLLAGFAVFALFRGQIKGNWILPAFLGLWPVAFSRPNLPSRPLWFLVPLVLIGLLHTLPIALGLKYPTMAQHLNAALPNQVFNASYVSLVALPDRRREASYSWTERLCEYSGWRQLADDLEKTLAQKKVPPSTPLLSTQYGFSFAMLYYGLGTRPGFTVDDPRFRFLTDFQQQAGPDFPAQALFAAREHPPLPASLQTLYPKSRLLAELSRLAAGCPPVRYRVFLLRQ